MDARAGSLWHKIAGEAIPRNIPRHRGGPVWLYSPQFWATKAGVLFSNIHLPVSSPICTALSAVHPLLTLPSLCPQKKFKVMNLVRPQSVLLIFELQVKFVLWSGLIRQFYHEILLQ